MKGVSVDYLVLPFAPGIDTKIYTQPELGLGENQNWHVFDYSADHFCATRYIEELEEYIQLHCAADNLILVAHSLAARICLEFLNNSDCYPDGIAWIHPILEMSEIDHCVCSAISGNTRLEDKLDRWGHTLINKESISAAHSLVHGGTFNERLFNQYQRYLSSLTSVRFLNESTKLPSFGLCGGLDPICSFETMNDSMNPFFSKSLTQLNDIGHCSFIECPNVLAMLLEDFVTSLNLDKSRPRQDNDLRQRKLLPDLD